MGTCLLVAGIALAGVTRTAPAPSLLQSLSWRSIGPFRGGRVLAITGVPSEPEHFYFGAVNGGVWETRNAGRTWGPIFDATGVGSIGAIAIAASDPKIIYVGTGEPDMRSDIAQGEGMFRSADAGHTWQRAGLEDSRQIGRILVDPSNADIVLVAVLGHPYGANETRGVYRSTDGGRTWRRTLYKDSDTGAIELAAAAAEPNVVYAALWRTRRPPWSVYPPSSGPGGGLYKSVDGGQTWLALTGHGLPLPTGRIGIAVSPSMPRRIYALIDATDGGLYRSDDAGANWARITDDKRVWGRGWYFGGVTVDPNNPDVLYICNTAVYRSVDGGKNFVPVKGSPGGDDYHQLWIDPVNAERRALAVDQGALVTVDGGKTWSSWFNQPIGQFYHVATDQRFPYWVYGAQQDSGAAGIPSRTDNIADGINMTNFREVAPGGELDSIAPDPDDPQMVFGGRVDRLDLRTGQTTNVDPTLAHPDLYRATWTLPLVFSKAGRHALYFGNQRVFRSMDRGGHWDPVSPDLTRQHPQIPGNLDGPSLDDHENPGERRGVVYSLGPSPRDEQLIWAGTDDGLVWRTRDGGAHWQNLTPAALKAWSKISAIEPSHFDLDTVYIAVDRHRLDDSKPYIYRSRDGGASWTLITDGISGAAVNSVNVVREDPVQRGLLYAGTERGMYVSFDDGAHWQALQQNLPRTSVRDLEVHGDDLVIATHGRGFWIMDDVAPLRTFAQDPRPTTRLLPPARAYRSRPSGFLGTPLPRDEPLAEDPPLGAYLDYVLDDSAGNDVTLAIIDAGGARVRSFSSHDTWMAPDLTKVHTAPEWYPHPAPISTTPGTHRVVWDLRGEPVPAFAPDDLADGETTVWLPPGQYQVELSAGGQVYRQPLTVLPDPRVKLSAEAYERQFALARDIERARLEIDAASKDATRLHAAIIARAKGASGAVADVLAATDKRLVGVADIAVVNPWPDFTGAAPISITGLRYLEGAFKKLAIAVDGADGAPTADAERGYMKHRALLDASLAAWSAFKATDLAAADAAFAARGEPPL